MPIIYTSAQISSIVGKYVNDKNRIIPKAHLGIVCQRSKGASACRYLCSLDPLESENREFICMKNTPAKSIIDNEVKNPSWKAKGDNCDGFGEMDAKKEENHEES